MSEAGPLTMTPIRALATAMAYMIVADGITKPEERARVITLLGKHVSLGHIGQGDLQKLSMDAFAYAARHDFDRFLIEIEPVLTSGQALATLLNIYDAMLVDGNIAQGEKDVVARFAKFFGINPEFIRGIREVLLLKNDTNLFYDDGHPANAPDYELPIAYSARTD